MPVTKIQKRTDRLIAGFFILVAIGLSFTYLLNPIEHFDAEEKITRAFVNYWLAYPITFITGEEIIAAPYHSHERYSPYTREIENSPEFAYIFKGHQQLLGEREENMLIINHTPYRKKSYPWGYFLIIDAAQTQGGQP